MVQLWLGTNTEWALVAIVVSAATWGVVLGMRMFDSRDSGWIVQFLKSNLEAEEIAREEGS